jgi:hypothetical protein
LGAVSDQTKLKQNLRDASLQKGNAQINIFSKKALKTINYFQYISGIFEYSQVIPLHYKFG